MNTQESARELSIGETLERTIDIYLKNLTTFLAPMIVTAIVSGIAIFALQEYISNLPILGAGATSEEILHWFSAYVPELLAIALAVGLISWIVSTIVSGVCIKCASDIIEKNSASLMKAFQFTVNKLLSLLAASIITIILILLGTLALIAPGIILSIMFFLVTPAIMIEGTGAIDSLSRSKRLVDSCWLKTFIFMLIIGAVVMFVGFIGSLIGAPFGWFSWVASSIFVAFIEPIIPISTTLYYYSMLAREKQRTLPPPPPPF
jgi:hypothetical protein